MSPGVQAYRRRAAATERMIDAAVAEARAERAAEYAAAKQEHAERESARRRYAREDIEGAGFIHDGHRWRVVVRVNAQTVSVDSGYSWVDRIKFKDVHGVQKPLVSVEEGSSA